MSFTVRVRVVDGMTYTRVEGDIPDGEVEVSGHADASGVAIGVTQRGPDGRYVAGAAHHHPIEV